MPQVVMMLAMTSSLLMWTLIMPRTLASIAAHKHTSTSRPMIPKSAQQSLWRGLPRMPPRMGTHTPSFTILMGQVAGGGGVGVVIGGVGTIGGGIIGTLGVGVGTLGVGVVGALGGTGVFGGFVGGNGVVDGGLLGGGFVGGNGVGGTVDGGLVGVDGGLLGRLLGFLWGL